MNAQIYLLNQKTAQLKLILFCKPSEFNFVDKVGLPQLFNDMPTSIHPLLTGMAFGGKFVREVFFRREKDNCPSFTKDADRSLHNI